MLLILLASAAIHLRPLTASAHGRHACVRLLSTAPGAPSIACPKFLVTTVAPKSQPNADGKFVFNSKDKESTKLPVFLVDVKYEDKVSIAAEWKNTSDHGKGKTWTEDKGEGDFSGTVVTQDKFTALLAKEAEDKELLFFIHGFSVQAQDMVTSTDDMQTNCNASAEPKKVLVVPVDWACTNPEGLIGETPLNKIETYYPDQVSSEKAGKALWELFSSLKKEGPNSQHTLNVIAHSMGNRVLRCMGQEAVKDDNFWTEKCLMQGKSLLKAAPEYLQDNENFFENIFFVSADIPESVFDEPKEKPDGSLDGEQAEHALQSGVAALAVMTKRMHVLHANGHDMALAGSTLLNMGNARLGERGPRSGVQIGAGPVWLSVGSPAKVWDKIGDALEKYEGIETDVNKNYNNVYVQDCSGWNRNIDSNGHSYQCDPKSVDYYLNHMTIDQSMTKDM